MGGLLRAPAPPSDSAAAQPQPASASRTAPDQEARSRRLAAIEARRRGLAGTVATSWRGVLADALPPANRKSLLGE
jgi:hypothetical protein